MAAVVGRKVTLTPSEVGGVAILGGRSTSITLNSESIDITSNDDGGFRTLLGDDPALQSLDVSLDGVLKDASLLSKIVGATTLIEGYDLLITGIGTFSGDFYLGSVGITAPTQDATTYAITLQSSGEFTFVEAT